MLKGLLKPRDGNLGATVIGELLKLKAKVREYIS